jgi:drug/metabolite transporter (DMT)-like permease
MNASGDRVALWAFLGTNVTVGANPVAVRFSNRELDPFWGAGFRFVLAAVMFAAIMAIVRPAVPRGQPLWGAVMFGALNFAGAVGFAYYGFVHIHAGLGQLVYSMVPLVTLLLASAQRQERLQVRSIVGALFAVGGVLVLAEGALQETVPIDSALAFLASLLCLSQGAVAIRQFPPVHTVPLNLIGCMTAALVLIPVAALSGEELAVPRERDTWLALAYLVFIGSGLMFVLYIVVLRRWAASRAAYVFVVSPFLTIVLSAWLDDEPVGTALIAGGAIILAGVYLGALRPPPAVRVPAVPPP